MTSSPTGRIIEGHVLDCSRKPLERKLKEYDAQLYLKWNKDKLHGWGCWELRRRPLMKTYTHTQYHRDNFGAILRIVPGDVHHLDGCTIVEPKYHENDFENHVMDVPFLNYSIIEKIKKMDTWEHSTSMGFAHDYEYLEAKVMENEDEKSNAELTYSAKQYKREIRDFKEFLLSGNSPARIADYWNNK